MGSPREHTERRVFQFLMVGISGVIVLLISKGSVSDRFSK